MKSKIAIITLMTVAVAAGALFYFSNLNRLFSSPAFENQIVVIAPMPNYNNLLSGSGNRKSVPAQTAQAMKSTFNNQSPFSQIAAITSSKSWSGLNSIGSSFTPQNEKMLASNSFSAGGDMLPLLASRGKSNVDLSASAGSSTLSPMSSMQMPLMINSTSSAVPGDPGNDMEVWGATSPPEGAPVGNGVILLLLMAVGYGFVRFRK